MIKKERGAERGRVVTITLTEDNTAFVTGEFSECQPRLKVSE